MVETINPFSVVEVTLIINSIKQANLTPRQAVKAIWEYRENQVTKTTLRRASKGKIIESRYRGKGERYHTYESKK